MSDLNVNIHDFRNMLARFEWQLLEYETISDEELLNSYFNVNFVHFVSSVGKYAERLAPKHRKEKELTLKALERARLLYKRFRDAVEEVEIDEIEARIESDIEQTVRGVLSKFKGCTITPEIKKVMKLEIEGVMGDDFEAEMEKEFFINFMRDIDGTLYDESDFVTGNGVSNVPVPKTKIKIIKREGNVFHGNFGAKK